MRPKILYISLAVLVILILIIIWANKKSLSVLHSIPEKKTAPAQITTQVKDMLMQSRVAPEYYGPAITIIKPPQMSEPNSVRESKEIPETEKQANISTSNSSISRQHTEAAVVKSEPGTTKISKHPSEAEANEMKRRGIVMW